MTQLRDFRHLNPTTLEEATTLLGGEGDHPGNVRAYAGGTDLLGVLKDEVHPGYPDTVVNLKSIAGLRQLEETGRDGADGAPDETMPSDEESGPGLRVGALVTLRRLECDPVVRERYPLLAQAAAAVAAPQLRNMGTVAGNICQEPRCWYYRHPENTFHCTRKGGVHCNAFTGENRFHSIFGSTNVGTRPCTAACPGSVHIPEYMALIREGELDRAADLLLESNPLPAVTGRVCPHYCESDCNRNQFDQPVSVRAVERYLGDHILEHADRFHGPPACESGSRVAVVGSGPAGLAAAYYLRRAGHQVVVFERQPEPGGMLRYAIPGYRLPLGVLQRTIEALSADGIEFRTGIEVGSDLTLADLRRDYAAVFLGPGAWGRPQLGLDGETLLESGLEFLRRIRLGERPPVGRSVVVIGGGNVAVDVAVAAKRLGAASVTMACLETCDEMPAYVQEVDHARKEGVTILDSCGPARIRTDDAGRLVGLDFMRCVCVFDDAGRFAPAFDEADTNVVEADQVILAIGQKVELGALGGDGVVLEGGRLTADPESGAGSLPGVFAGGDAVTGPATVIAAIASGRRAAGAIDARLSDNGVSAAALVADGAVCEPADTDAGRVLQSFAPSCLGLSARAAPAQRPSAECSIDQADAPAGIAPHELAAEGDRCFNCGCVAVTPSDLAPALVALDAEVVSTRRVIPAAEFFAAREGSSTVLSPGELLTEIRVPAPTPGRRSVYQKFRLRQAIDFPILGVACVVDVTNGVVRNARLVFGAAAPFPVRARAAETFLEGKVLDAHTIGEAARLSVEDSRTLAMNHYKLQVARGLVGKALARLAD